MLTQRITAQGQTLFRWRSYLPFAILLPGAIAGSRFEYFGSSHEAQHIWAFACLGLSLFGLAIRVGVVGYAQRGTSGRNTDGQKAVDLNTTGLYSIVRNPLYLGNYIIWLGLVLVLADPIFALAYSLAFWLYYERIIAAEEEFLAEKFGQRYLLWCEQTPPFLPRISNWQRSDRAFSVNRVLKREYCGLFGITTGYFLMDVAEHLWVDRRLYIDTSWTVIFVFGAITFITLRTLRKRTSLLVEPR